jgi:apolipoprotein N-acyltransferase
MTREALTTRRSEQPALVIWPENILTTPIEKNPRVLTEVRAAVSSIGVPVVLGHAGATTSGELGDYRNQASWIDPSGRIVDSVDKTLGLPMAEERGGPLTTALRAVLGAPDGRFMQPGREERPLRGHFELAVVLCYEAIVPSLVAGRRTSQTVAILNLANDGWIASPGAEAQQVAFSSFRAIEQRLSLVRVAHGGTSVVVDAFGRRVAGLERGKPGVLDAEIRRHAPPTRAEAGGLLCLMLAGAIAGSALFSIVDRRKA